ncbi:hypothetical protein CK215_24445 [Mesorhizobium sp. WSM3864]|nr:hypothetical protein CK215_24445 [Mesorhizobium sp. WSM3864]
MQPHIEEASPDMTPKQLLKAGEERTSFRGIFDHFTRIRRSAKSRNLQAFASAKKTQGSE